MSGVLAEALACAARGWRVFPCAPGGDRPKAPLVMPDKDAAGQAIAGSGWPVKASCDAATIQGWWRRWPDALIGMAPGWAGGFVVDLDPKGESVAEVEARLVEAVGPLPEGVARARTQSGGQHLWFRRPEGGMGNHAPGLKNIDIRCDAGYVILPPSRMANGNAYEWLTAPFDPAAAPEVPAGLLAMIRARRDKSAKATAPISLSPATPLSGGEAGLRAARAYGAKALDNICGDLGSAGKGQRGRALFSAGAQVGRLIAAGALDDSAVGALEAACQSNGLWKDDGPKSVRRELANGLKEGMADAGDMMRRIADIMADAEAKAARFAGGRRPAPPDLDPNYGEVTVRERALLPPIPVARIAAMVDEALENAVEPPAPLRGEGYSDEQDEGEPEGDAGPSDVPVEGVDLAAVQWCAGLDHSDTDNGKRLIAHFGQDLAVMREEGGDKPNWLVWRGTHWDQLDGGRQALAVAQKVGGRIGLEADMLCETPYEAKAIREGGHLIRRKPADLSDDDRALRDAALEAAAALEKRQGKRRTFAVSSKNLARLNAMLTCAAPFLVQPPDAWNAEARLVYLRNGTLRFARVEDADAGGAQPAWKGVHSFTPAGWRREDRVTRIVDVDYDAAARCPLWLAFLERFLPDDAVRRAVQIFCGLGLTGLPVQRLFFHYGLGANGKSVFLEVLSRVLGALAVGLPAESISGSSERGAGAASPDLARLHGARFVRITELPQGEPLREALVKRLTGGEDIDVRTLFKGYFAFKPQFKAHMSGNGYPRIEGSDNGIWRRMAVVPWTVTLPEAEQRDFEEVVSELTAEASGILNWLIAGMEAHDADGLKLPAAMVDAAQEFRDEVDPINLFITSCVRAVAPEAQMSVGARLAYDAYVSWSLANGKGKGRHETTFGKVMGARFAKARRETGNVYLDIELVDVPARPRNPESDHDDRR